MYSLYFYLKFPPTGAEPSNWLLLDAQCTIQADSLQNFLPRLFFPLFSLILTSRHTPMFSYNRFFISCYIKHPLPFYLPDTCLIIEIMTNTTFCSSFSRKWNYFERNPSHENNGMMSRQFTVSEEDYSFLCGEAAWLQRSGSFTLGMKLDIQATLLSRIWGAQRDEIFVF
jgi:hypothetical protein